MKIIGRKKEQEDLRSYFESPRPEFLAVYGRRRVGKTFLIKEFFKNDFTFYATGLANAPKSEQLEAFSAAIQAYGNPAEATEVPDSWLKAFIQLKKLVAQSNRAGKKVIFIDEMPWLDTPRSGFLTGLEYFWNSFASSRPDVLLIVCGSVSSWMINKLLRNHGGLYNRVTQRMRLTPFTLLECEEFFRECGCGFSRYQILEFYMVFGGVPHYLGMIRKSLSVTQNIDRLCFAADAPLKNEFNEMLSSLFREPQRHTAIIRALAGKAKGLTREEIISTTKIANGGNLTKALEELEQCGILRRYYGFDRKRKESLFQLVDFFSNFHFRFLVDMREGAEGYWLACSNKPGHGSWSGYAFEQVCLAHLSQIKARLGIAGVIAPAYSWRSRGEEDVRPTTAQSPASDIGEPQGGAQVDLVLDRDDNVINLCEMKYVADEFVISKGYDRQLREKRAAFIRQTKTRKAVHITMVTTYGLEHNTYWGNIQSEVTAEDLFR
jgi:AAA+ ATPase superfamily predicted ATPase